MSLIKQHGNTRRSTYGRENKFNRKRSVYKYVETY